MAHGKLIAQHIRQDLVMVQQDDNEAVFKLAIIEVKQSLIDHTDYHEVHIERNVHVFEDMLVIN